MLRKLSNGRAGYTRTSELALLTSCTPRDGFDVDRRVVKISNALLALRRLPVVRYGKIARDA
jgi:hypothetical protein